MKKRVFISVYYMHIGGVERSLIGLLESFNYEKYDVDLFIHNHSGEFMKLIPENVNLLPEIKSYATFGKPISQIFKQGFFCIGIARLLAKFKSLFVQKLKIDNNISSFLYITKYTSIFLPSFKKNGKYDVAISFIAPHNIVVDKVLAKKYLAWIHTDYSQVGIDKKIEYSVWRKYEYIVSISDGVTDSFIKVFPELKNRIIKIENIISPDFILKQSSSKSTTNEISTGNNEINLCSIGRLGRAKNFENAVIICKYLIEMGLSIKWYIIGDGAYKNRIDQKIIENNLQNIFILLGSKSNPYPYIKNCDFYVQPSLYEGKAVAVREAQILHKLVIVTNFPTASSQINHKIDGFIVPLDNHSAAQEMFDFILDKTLQQKIIKNLKETNFDNSNEIEKLYKIIDET